MEEDAQRNSYLFEEYKATFASRGKKQGLISQQMSLRATNQNKSVSELLEGLIKSHSLVPWSTDDVYSEAWLY